MASYENFESTRGMDYAMAHFSEVAYWKTTDGKSAEQVITNIDSNILERPLTMEISESTANGMAGYFYDEYQMAKEGTSSRKALFIPFFFIENDMIRFKDKKETRLFILDLLGEGMSRPPLMTIASRDSIYGLYGKKELRWSTSNGISRKGPRSMITPRWHPRHHPMMSSVSSIPVISCSISIRSR